MSSETQSRHCLWLMLVVSLSHIAVAGSGYVGHRRRVLSPAPDTMVFPSGLNATLVTKDVCPVSGSPRGRPVSASHTRQDRVRSTTQRWRPSSGLVLDAASQSPGGGAMRMPGATAGSSEDSRGLTLTASSIEKLPTHRRPPGLMRKPPAISGQDNCSIKCLVRQEDTRLLVTRHIRYRRIPAVRSGVLAEMAVGRAPGRWLGTTIGLWAQLGLQSTTNRLLSNEMPAPDAGCAITRIEDNRGSRNTCGPCDDTGA